MSLRAFVEKGFDIACDNYQARYLFGPSGFDFKASPVCTEAMFEAALNHLEREFFFFVGIAEDFDKLLMLLVDLMGWPAPYYVPANISRAAASTDPATLAAIQERNVFDRRLHEYAATHLQATCAAQPLGFFDRLDAFTRHNKLLRAVRRIDKGGALSGGHYTVHSAESAFDGTVSSIWISAQQGSDVSGGAWIGYDFGLQRPTIRRFAISQNSMPPAAPVTKMRLEASDDGFVKNVRVVEEFVMPTDSEMHTRNISTAETARAWRLVATADAGSAHWGVSTLVFSEQHEPPRVTDRMDSFWRADIGDAICYHHAAGRPARAAFDGNAANWWESADSDPLIDGIAWSGFDLGPGMSFPCAASCFGSKRGAPYHAWLYNVATTVSSRTSERLGILRRRATACTTVFP